VLYRLLKKNFYFCFFEKTKIEKRKKGKKGDQGELAPEGTSPLWKPLFFHKLL